MGGRQRGIFVPAILDFGQPLGEEGGLLQKNQEEVRCDNLFWVFDAVSF